MTARRGCFLAWVFTLAACEPSAPAALLVDGLSCAAGSLPADFTGLVVGVPFDHAFRVTDEGGGLVEVDATFADGSDPSLTLLRAPFVSEGALVVPFRVQPLVAGTVEGVLDMTPSAGELGPCRIAVSASTG